MNYVQVEDFLPAGLEPVDVSLKTTSREILDKLGEEARSRTERLDSACRFYYSFYSCYSPFSHSDLRDDRVGLFAQSLPKGTFEYTYFARATTPGTYQVRPAYVSEV